MEVAGKFTTMNFQPPLLDTFWLPSSVTPCLCAAEPRDPAEHLQLEALNPRFCGRTRNFRLERRSYPLGRPSTAVRSPPAATARRE